MSGKETLCDAQIDTLDRSHAMPYEHNHFWLDIMSKKESDIQCASLRFAVIKVDQDSGQGKG